MTVGTTSFDIFLVSFQISFPFPVHFESLNLTHYAYATNPIFSFTNSHGSISASVLGNDLSGSPYIVNLEPIRKIPLTTFTMYFSTQSNKMKFYEFRFKVKRADEIWPKSVYSAFTNSSTLSLSGRTWKQLNNKTFQTTINTRLSDPDKQANVTITVDPPMNISRLLNANSNACLALKIKSLVINSTIPLFLVETFVRVNATNQNRYNKLFTSFNGKDWITLNNFRTIESTDKKSSTFKYHENLAIAKYFLLNDFKSNLFFCSFDLRGNFVTNSDFKLL